MLEKIAKVLEITIDRRICFYVHIKEAAKKAAKMGGALTKLML